MEENSVNQYANSYSSNSANMNIGGNKQDEIAIRPQYTMPGILQFLQTEWAKFEMDRAQWDVERAELQVKN